MAWFWAAYLMTTDKRGISALLIQRQLGLKRYETSEYACHDAAEFVSISVTGTACALECEHCAMQVLRGMDDLVGDRRI